MTARAYRSLDKKDLRRMNLPEALWRATLSGVPAGNRSQIEKYLGKIHDAVERGVGLILTGPAGVGKSGIAAVVAKHARSYAYTTYFISFWELRDAIRDETRFDESQTIFARAKGVDVLILDNLRSEDTEEKFYLSMRAIEEILSYRQDRNKVTILTSSMKPDQLRKMKGLVDVLDSFLKVEVSGPNLREKQAADLKKDFLGEN